MRIPPFERYTKWLAKLGLFVAGMIVGSALFVSMYEHNFSLIAVRNQSLHAEVEKLTADIESLNVNKNKFAYINRVTVRIEKNVEVYKLDEITENEIRKKVAKDLQILISKPAALLKEDPLLYRKLIDEKIYPAIHDKDYIVHVKTLMLFQSELTVYIQALPFRK